MGNCVCLQNIVHRSDTSNGNVLPDMGTQMAKRKAKVVFCVGVWMTSFVVTLKMTAMLLLCRMVDFPLSLISRYIKYINARRRTIVAGV